MQSNNNANTNNDGRAQQQRQMALPQGQPLRSGVVNQRSDPLGESVHGLARTTSMPVPSGRQSSDQQMETQRMDSPIEAEIVALKSQRECKGFNYLVNHSAPSKTQQTQRRPSAASELG